MFNDMLGNTLGIYGKDLQEVKRTSFGSGDETGFFTGKPYVKELGAVFLFRNYRSDLGKWQTADPLGYPDGWNNFAYINNHVISSIDFLGALEVIAKSSVMTSYVKDALSYMSKSATGKSIVDAITNDPNLKVVVEEQPVVDVPDPNGSPGAMTKSYDPSYTGNTDTSTGGTMNWGPSTGTDYGNGNTQTPGMVFAHELIHAYLYMTGKE